MERCEDMTQAPSTSDYTTDVTLFSIWPNVIAESCCMHAFRKDISGGFRRRASIAGRLTSLERESPPSIHNGSVPAANNHGHELIRRSVYDINDREIMMYVIFLSPCHNGLDSQK